MVEINKIGKTYNSASGSVQALEDISLTVPPGQFLSIIGPSGCGKSTLAKIVGDLVEPTVGSVLVDGFSARGAGKRNRIDCAGKRAAHGGPPTS